MIQRGYSDSARYYMYLVLERAEFRMERGQGLVYTVKGHLKSTNKPVSLLFQSLCFIFDVRLFIRISEGLCTVTLIIFFITGTAKIYLSSIVNIDCLGK